MTDYRGALGGVQNGKIFLRELCPMGSGINISSGVFNMGQYHCVVCNSHIGKLKDYIIVRPTIGPGILMPYCSGCFSQLNKTASEFRQYNIPARVVNNG